MPHPCVVCEVMQLPALLQQPEHVAAQDRPPSPEPPPPPPPPWPKVLQLPSEQTWFSTHALQTWPLMPHAELELPGLHVPVVSQQPAQVLGPHVFA